MLTCGVRDEISNLPFCQSQSVGSWAATMSLDRHQLCEGGLACDSSAAIAESVHLV